jgi:hypothetical protein
MTRVAILGVTGEMGSRVARLLGRWIPNAQVIGANRSGRGHSDFPVRVVEVDDEAALSDLARGADLLVNCVGPYDHDPVAIVKACVQNQCHYADLAEIPEFVARVRNVAKVFDARKRGVAVVPGCSTVPGLTQLLATHWRDRADVFSVDAFLAMASKSPGSRALLTGLVQPLGRSGPEGRWYIRTEKVETSAGRRIRGGRYPTAFPDAGIRIGQRRVPFNFHIGFDRAWISRVLAFFAPVIGWLPRSWVPGVARMMVPIARLAALVGTPNGVLVQIARDIDGAELARIEVLARSNGLDVPAAPALWLAHRLALTGSLPVSGAVDLDQLIAWEDARAWLRGAGYEVVER